MFEKKGLIEVLAEDRDEDEVMMEALEAGADDIEKEDDKFIIYTPYNELHSVLNQLESDGYKVEKAELTMIAKNTTS